MRGTFRKPLAFCRRVLRWALRVDEVGYVGWLEPGATGLLLLLLGKVCVVRMPGLFQFRIKSFSWC